MLISIDPTSSEPLFEQIARHVRTAVYSGALAPHDRLPAARTLAETLGINVHTVLKAYQQLREEGTIHLHRGRGAVVADVRSAASDEIHTLAQHLAERSHALNLSPDMTLAILKEKLS